MSARRAASFVNSAVRVELGARRAALEHYRLQELGARSILVRHADRDARAGCRLPRCTPSAPARQSARSTSSRAPGGRARRPAHRGRRARRRASRCRTASRWSSTPRRARAPSRLFRGIAAGRARVAFNGKIVVAPGAHGTDSQQSLRGLLAGPEAEIDVRPQLEIYTDDVRCSHGATAGKLDDNMLFYLLSRGLEPRDGAAPAEVGVPRGCGRQHRGAASCGGRSSRAWPASAAGRRAARSCCDGREPALARRRARVSTSSACARDFPILATQRARASAGVPRQRRLLAAPAARCCARSRTTRRTRTPTCIAACTR